jgi:hypothetical protein
MEKVSDEQYHVLELKIDRDDGLFVTVAKVAWS